LLVNRFIKNKEEKEFGSVGEFGNKVSGGQRQKIGIARALYSNRSILIFDESTNSMDHLTANKIVDQIYKLKDKTIIFITHSNDLAKKFDEIYILKNKKIVKTN
jgi:ABC-type transport system involved in cytochrome bd biosynthesis, ATPase and permease components